MPAVEEPHCGHAACEDNLSFTSRQHRRLCVAGVERWSETMNFKVPPDCNHALRPPIQTENLCWEQEQATNGLSTLRHTFRLKKCLPGADVFFADTLSKHRPKAKGPKACSSNDEYERAEFIQTSSPPYQTKSSSVKTRWTLTDPSTLDQARTKARSLKDDPRLMLQPESRPISQEQLVAEVKAIYAGLIMVEAKCIEIDSKQAAAGQDFGNQQSKLSHNQWQALIALHRTLLHEHHDFFLASQHPSASPALKRFAAKYTIPARMWRHGIHNFLELLRHRLPDSLEHFLTFIYLAYSMMALLYEAVPAFEDTWIECLGDIGRYRMAIEDEDIRNRDIWSGVARFWYSKASEKSAATGRLHHHLAILARPNVTQQWSLYGRALLGGLYSKKEDLARQKNDAPFGATGRKIQFPLSISGWTMLWIGSFLGMTALCSPLALQYGWPQNHLVTRLLYLLLASCAPCYVTACIEAIASGGTLAFASKPGLSRKCIRDAAKICGPEDKQKLVQGLQQLHEPAAATSDTTDTDTALKRVDISFSINVAGTQVACDPGVTGLLGRSLRATVTCAYTLLRGPSLSARIIRPSRTCGLAVWLLSMRRVSAVAVPPGDLSAVTPTFHAATGRSPAFSEWSFPILCVVILAICWFFARLKRWEPSNILGTWAAIYWYLWLYLIRYADISPWYPWSIWGMGTIILLCFIRLGFQKNVLFLSSVTAIPVTMGAVGYLPDLRSDHLAAFPPCFNVSLAFWIFAAPVLIRMGGSLIHQACHLGDFLGRHIRGVVRRLRVPWHPEEELPLHRRD